MVELNQDEASRLRQLIMGFRITQLIYVAAKLDLSEHLSRASLTAAELARKVGADADALYRLLRALASIGVYAETADARFEMTPAARLLLRNEPGSLRSTAMLYGDELIWGSFGRMSHAIETGRPAFEYVYGRPFFDYLGEHSDAGSLFHEAMTGFSEIESASIIAASDLSGVRTVVDVGGGQGALAAALLRAHPQLRAVIFDRSGPTPDTQRLFALADIAGRGEFVQGDFFARVPEGGDLYLLKSVLHNWDDTAAGVILCKCREAMPKHARLLVAERVIPQGNVPSESKLFDINMLVNVGGRERSEDEYACLLQSAGLQLTKVTPTTSHLSLIEAARADR
jgi:hypothetical protein